MKKSRLIRAFADSEYAYSTSGLEDICGSVLIALPHCVTIEEGTDDLMAP